MSEKYPREVELIKELVKATEVKETHSSYALITDEFVYKIKKAVDFGFLNYTQTKDRKKFCLLEKELNERFSEGIYLQVLKLCKRNNLEYSLEPVESSLFAIEYVLKMKRIADRDFLQSRIEDNKITDEDMVQVGEEVASLLITLDNATQIDDDNHTAYDTVKFNVEENFEQTKPFVGKFINKDIYDFLKSNSLKFLQENEATFNSRAENNFVKNGHGDLRLEHIYFDKDDNVGLIDCIEFNKRFRYNDVISEGAFLSMELDFKGLSKQADLFLEGFFNILPDETSRKLLNFYRSYLAYVRAKVTLFQVATMSESSGDYKVKVDEAHRLLHLSFFYLNVLINPTTLLFYGLMGTGKTANALAFTKFLPYSYISSDVVRKFIAGMEITEKAYLDYNNGIYSKENSYKVYDIIADKVNQALNIGRVSIIDASFTDSRYYEIVKERVSTAFFNIKFDAPDNVIMERLKSRLTKNSISDGRPAIYNEQKISSTLPPEEITIISTGAIEDNVKNIFKELVSRCK